MSLSIKERAIRIISEKLCIKEELVTEKSLFEQDLGADSLDTIELVMAMEDTFDVDIADEDADKMKTVGDAIAYLEKKLAKE